MNSINNSARIHRLLDMVVEEVSLVDRAANKQRFLIVKRSDVMKNTTEQASDAGTAKDTGIDNQDTATGSSGSDAAKEDKQEITTETAKEDGSTLQQIAVSALTHLTEAVELLGNTEDESAKVRVAELAGELRNVAERLAGPADSLENQRTESGDKGSDIESLIASVKAALERVNALISGGDTDTAKADGKEDKHQELLAEMKGLTQAIKDQQQRLTKLEKRFGMPSSVPVGEKQNEPDEVGWPLDMNRSCDRESVDKAVSFHDV